MIILHDAFTISGEQQTILIKDGLLYFSAANADKNTCHIEGDYLVFPGLINSHDHLDFDLFPQLGNRIYADYVEWGEDIHTVNKPTINAVLKVPRQLRVKWGVYKNLLAGVTTVVHHGHYVDAPDAPIHVFQDCNMLHSVQLEKRWQLKVNKPFAGKRPLVTHIGEGTNKAAHEEIDRLIKWNLFKRKLVGIHGISMDVKQAAAFEALVWCPDSNFFLNGATAAIDQLKHVTRILFGTDSTVSASWNIWEQLRLARQTGLLTDAELLASITTSAAGFWKLPEPGFLQEGKQADIILVKKKQDFFAVNPEDIMLIVKKGRIILFDKILNLPVSGGYSKVYLQNTCKYVVGDVSALIKEIRQYAPGMQFPVRDES